MSLVLTFCILAALFFQLASNELASHIHLTVVKDGSVLIFIHYGLLFLAVELCQIQHWIFIVVGSRL